MPDKTGPGSAATQEGDPADLRIVGIAASAGGLEAVSLLAQNLPAKANASYIVAQHMSPTNKSLLSSLIARETALPVIELGEDVAPEPDTIYVSPPNWDVIYQDGRICRRTPSSRPASPKPSADRLFKSLAASCGERSVAIVLSGTGSDGSYGTQDVREAGGITIAQDVASAKYDGMPASAIDTGCVDLTLTPEQIGEHLKKILSPSRDFEPLRHLDEEPGRVSTLLKMLLARTRVDFRDYKENTVNRRITRRMTALGIEDVDAYVDHCRTSEQELDALHRDLLISVTRFFRDRDQFDQLRREIEKLVAQSRHRQIRVWVAGCATGEEAYSVAILFAEAMGGRRELTKDRLQIFATDIDERALGIARRASYPASAADDIPPDYLSRYFVESGGKLMVAAELRAVTLFSRHNIFHDPPFICVSLVSLRNVLIYFNAALQERVLNRVLTALSPGGLLFLGTAESIGHMDVRLESPSPTDKIFTKRAGFREGALAMSSPQSSRLASQRQKPDDSAARAEDLHGKQFDALAKAVAENGFLATRSGDIVRVFGDISPYIEVSENSLLSLSIRLLKAPFRDDVTGMIAVVLLNRKRRRGRVHDFAVGSDNRVQIECIPLAGATQGEDHVLVSFQTRHEAATTAEIYTLTDAGRQDYIARLESENEITREALQQTVEELRTANEELQSVNEEMQSTNEELQSTNEELETSNEELQSTNEELVTVNEEMQINAAQLQVVSTEAMAILAASPFLLLVVDETLTIRKASDLALDFFKLGDLPHSGVHLSRCKLPTGFPELTRAANDVFRQGRNTTFSVESDGRFFSVSIAPYSGPDSTVVGLTIAAHEFDSDPFRMMTEMMDSMAGISRWSYNVYSGEVFWSPEIYRMHGLSPDQPPPSLEEAFTYFHPDEQQMIREKFDASLRADVPFGFEARIVRADGGITFVQSAGAVARDRNGEPTYIVGAIRDWTRELAERMLVRNFSEVQDDFGIGFYSMDIANSQNYWSRGLYLILGLDPERDTPSIDRALARICREDRDLVAGLVQGLIDTGAPFGFFARIVSKAGDRIWCEGKGRARIAENGEVSHIYGSFCRLSPDRVAAETLTEARKIPTP
ncbi:chemotaxis protein CheB [Roseisalinus antarcticus]|uniref:protein-glutamate O-methyltransferase n=1 Tax=Roseisalinus antarcticus TaxID=254357 RepID=A0A1Y5SVD3_9RHOB|nr:chemotaxis protein CheB [Roseisalinus antarcticus]SLN49453.1 Chemotaxis protein methyltransferase [Roseisalinus antarcticus]